MLFFHIFYNIYIETHNFTEFYVIPWKHRLGQKIVKFCFMRLNFTIFELIKCLECGFTYLNGFWGVFMFLNL